MILFCSLTTENIRTKNERIEDALNRIAGGETEAVGTLYDLIKTDVFAYALSKTGNRADADDVTADTFVQIYKHAKQYTPMGKPMAWIITIELNLIRRNFQVRSRFVCFEEEFAFTSTQSCFEQRVIDNVFLREIMSSLSEEEREIISLHVVSGLKHCEIAKILKKPLSTVLSRYNRAIKKLQTAQKEGE